jgi:hypothetical protein
VERRTKRVWGVGLKMFEKHLKNQPTTMTHWRNIPGIVLTFGIHIGDFNCRNHRSRIFNQD